MANSTLISRILSSAVFTRIMGKAVKFTKNKAILAVLLQQSAEKMQSEGVREGMNDIVDKVKLLIRLVRAYINGEYRQVETKSLATIVGVLIYFVSPLDFIPDVLPILGLTDDIALVIWLFNTLGKELERFHFWEKDTKSIRID